ncbi:MAG: hypothetical protein AMXMBFR33_37150 [Candidatus Xenobia bacterium]
MLALLVTLASLVCALWAYRLGRTRFWLVGYILPLAIILAIGWIRQTNADFEWPWTIMMSGRREFVLLALSIATLLVTPLSRLPTARNRRAVIILTVILAGYAGVYPFLSPALSRLQIEAMQTRLDADGVCLQNSSYTCGPAAAVTVLRRLGVEADERPLALECGTCPATGTPCDQLAEGIERLYPEVECRFQRFEQASDMPVDTLAVVRLGPFVDHYVAVLEVSSDRVVLGDPLDGKRTMSHLELEASWRGLGLVLSRR